MVFAKQVRNVNDAFSEVWHWLPKVSTTETSRNGPVMVADEPVITEYLCPTERILWNARRDANPVFHLMESLWMIAGADHVDWLSQFNSRMKEYAESDGRIHGAYGARWHLQIPGLIQMLKTKPDTRQAVLQMWDWTRDLFGDWKDRPCNTHIYFDRRHDALNMTVCCRSNDSLWGAYGANAVHFSMLQEFIAHAVGTRVGVYRQFSNNFHVYVDLPMVRDFLDLPPAPFDRYVDDAVPVTVLPILRDDETWEEFRQDCKDLLVGGAASRTYFCRYVAKPLCESYLARKRGDMESFQTWKDVVPDCDWKVAYEDWLQRRTK